MILHYYVCSCLVLILQWLVLRKCVIKLFGHIIIYFCVLIEGCVLFENRLLRLHLLCGFYASAGGSLGFFIGSGIMIRIRPFLRVIYVINLKFQILTAVSDKILVYCFIYLEQFFSVFCVSP